MGGWEEREFPQRNDATQTYQVSLTRFKKFVQEVKIVMQLRRLLVLATMGLTVPGSFLPAMSQESLYEAKTIRIIVPFSAGGGFDAYARLIARHLAQHIPGQPTIIVENRPGAGGLVAAKYIYASVKPDGLTIGNIHGNLVLGQILGRKGVDLDSREFKWIGVPVKDTAICTISKARGLSSIKQWMASKEPVKLGGTAPGDAISDIPRILEVALNLPIKLVEGYSGGANIRLAVESGEIDGFCWAWDAAKATWGKELKSGNQLVVLQLAPSPHADLTRVPLAIDFAKTDEARQLIDAGIHRMQLILRSYVLPPGTPADRVEILRGALKETLKDPDLLEEAQKSKLGIDPVTGEEAEDIVNGLFQVNPKIVAKLKEILG